VVLFFGKTICGKNVNMNNIPNFYKKNQSGPLPAKIILIINLKYTTTN
jgi:hypothetical protein